MNALAFAIVLALLGSAPVDAQTSATRQSPVRTVLTVHWSAEHFPSTPQIDAAARRTFGSNPDMPVDYFAEYLESDRFPSEEATQALVDYIRRKCRRPADRRGPRRL